MYCSVCLSGLTESKANMGWLFFYILPAIIIFQEMLAIIIVALNLIEEHLWVTVQESHLLSYSYHPFLHIKGY